MGIHYGFLRQCRVNPLDRDEEAAFTGKEKSSGFKTSMSPASSKSTWTFPLQPTGSYSFPTNTFTLTVTPWSWEFNLHCNSASRRVKSCVWFSAIRFLLWHTEEFWSHLCSIWAENLNPWAQSFSFTTLSSVIRSNQAILLYCKFLKMFATITYTTSSVPLISGWLGVSNGGNFVYFYCQISP